MTSQMNSNQELFLDILTKEEREALLTKKMEEIRKRNEALRKRHEEIEADRKGFDASQKRVSSPQKESKQQFPEEVRKDVSAPADGRHKDSGRPRPKSAGRGRSPNKSHKDSQRAQDIRVIRTISGEERNTRNIRMLDESGGHNPQQKSNKQDNARLQRPVSKEYDDQEYHIRRPLREGNHDRQLNRNSAEFGDHGTYHGGMNGGRGSYQKLMRQHQQDRPHSGSYDKGPYFRQNSDGYQRQNSRENDSGRFANRQQQRQNSHEDYQRRESWENDHDHHMHQRNFGGRQNSRENDADYNNRQNFKEKRVKFENSDFEPQAKRKQGGGRGRGSPRKEIQGYDFSSSPQGPPPDPSYNFLADRSRDSFKGDNRNKEQFDRGDRGERGDNGRRHPKNYGGDDFHNVKSRMKRDKEKQDRVRSGPPKSKMEMSINMTGRERRQYVEWKAEREKVDQARIDRQKSSSGEWRREWDVQKDHNDYEDAPSPTRTEPAKRPAGRIGSGRFDRGELDDRQKGPGRPERGQGAKGQGNGLKGEKGEGHHKDGAMKHQNAMRNDKPGHGKDVGSPRQPVGRGRGRGRGWGKPGGNQEVGRIRTSSGDDRVVDLKKDLLVIKLDNTPGKPHDDSVEVEYSDSETSGTNHHGGAPGTTPPKKSGLQTEELWWDEEGDDMGMGLQLDDVLEHTELFEDDGTHDLKYDDEGHLLVGQTSQGDTDEWTDCTSEDFYSTDRSQTSTDADMSSPLRVNVHLNPDAPEFLPSAVLPVSPDSNVTPPGKVKVAKWREKERKRAHRSPKVSEGSRTGESELEDIPQNEEEVREDREKTPRGDNFEDSETVNESFEDAETVNDNDDKSGGVKNSEEDSEVKTESDLSGSTDDQASKEAPTVDNDIVNDMQNLNVKEGQDAESEGDVQNSDTADRSTDSQVKGSDSQTDKHPEVDPVVGDKDAGLPNETSLPSKPPSDDGEQKEEENKQEVQEVPTCSENDPKQTAEETEDVTGQEQKSETTDDKQAS